MGDRGSHSPFLKKSAIVTTVLLEYFCGVSRCPVFINNNSSYSQTFSQSCDVRFSLKFQFFLMFSNIFFKTKTRGNFSLLHIAPLLFSESSKKRYFYIWGLIVGPQEYSVVILAIFHHFASSEVLVK